MAGHKSLSGKIFDVCNYLALSFFSLFCLYPMLYCLFASISDPVLMDTHRGILWRPLGFSIESYKAVFKSLSIVNGFLYTLLILTVGTSMNLLLTSFAAYALSRKNVYWKKPIMLMILFTMYFSGGLIPSYLVIAKYLNLNNTMWAIILPGAISTFNMIIMRTYFGTLPDSLEESAFMDGASHFTILFKIMLPISMPILAVMIIYYGVSHWNGWFNAFLYLNNSKSWRPLQLLLRDILISNDTSQMATQDSPSAVEMTKRLVKYALIIISTVPIILIYPFLQKHFIGGVMIGSLKE